MNLELLDTHIKFVGIKEDLATVSVRDDVGFSTADLFSGFNYSDAATPFEDSIGDPYPAPEAVVMFVKASHIPYDDEESPDPDVSGTGLTVVRTSQEILAPVNEADGAAPGFDYGTVMNNWDIFSDKDGWLNIQMIALDIDSVTELYYYESSTGNVIRTSDGATVDVGEAFGAVDTSTAQLLKTSKLDYNIAKIISQFTFDTARGKCKDEDAWRKHITYLQTGRTAAKIQFDTFGNFFNAAFIIENLEKYILVNDLEIVE